MITRFLGEYSLNETIKSTNVLMKQIEASVKRFNISGQCYLLAKGNKSFILSVDEKPELVYIFRILKAATDYTPKELYKTIDNEFNKIKKEIEADENVLIKLEVISYSEKDDTWFTLLYIKEKDEYLWYKIDQSSNLIGKEKVLSNKNELKRVSEKYFERRKTFLVSNNHTIYMCYIDSLN